AGQKRRLRRPIMRCGFLGLVRRFVGVLVDYAMFTVFVMALLVRTVLLVVFALLHRTAKILECTAQVATQVAQTLGPEHHHDDGQQDQKLPDTDSTKHNYLYLSLAPNRYLIMHQIPARRRAPFGMTRKPMAATDFSH